MQQASLSSVVSRQQCSPIYLHLGLLYATQIPNEHIIGTLQGAPLSREAYLYVREPTDWGKHLLTIWDPHGNHMMSSVRSALYFRGQFGTVFPFQGQITQQMVNRLPQDLLKSGIDVAQWLVRPDAEVLTGHFHPLRFQVALDSSYPQTHLPAEGWTLQEGKTIAALIYFYFSLWVCKQNDHGAHGDSDDSRFRKSVLGKGIHRICNAPFTAGVQMLWQQRQRNCTIVWLRDLCSILECFSSFVKLRQSGQVFAGIMEIQECTTSSVLLAVNAELSTYGYGDESESLSNQVARLRNEIGRRWGQQQHYPDDPQWSTVIHSPLLPPSDPTKELFPSGGEGGKLPGNERNKKRKNGHDTEAIAVRQPICVLKSTVGKKDTIFNHLTKTVGKVKDFPKMVDPVTKKFRQICLQTSFTSHRTCSRGNQCRSKFYKVEGEESAFRLHIDLADPKWQSPSYPEENWAPLVTWLKTNAEHVAPSDHLKQVTPSATWE